MKHSLHTVFRAVLGALAIPAIAAALAACDVSSTDTVSANISNSNGETYDFSGTYYASTQGEPLVSPVKMQSGQRLTWLRLLQSGSSLQGFDSAKQNWSGSISDLNGSTAHFTLKGRTTTGHSVDIVGSLSMESGSAVMNGSWIEDNGNAASIYGYASVSTNSSSPTVVTNTIVVN